MLNCFLWLNLRLLIFREVFSFKLIKRVLVQYIYRRNVDLIESNCSSASHNGRGTNSNIQQPTLLKQRRHLKKSKQKTTNILKRRALNPKRVLPKNVTHCRSFGYWISHPSLLVLHSSLPPHFSHTYDSQVVFHCA